MPDLDNLSVGSPGFRECWTRFNVHRDKRGRIYRCGLNGTSFNVVYSKPGAYRAGDYHPHTQFDLVLSGCAEVRMTGADQTYNYGEHTRQIGLNERLVIPPDTAHLFYFPAATVMIEWWSGPFEAKFYKPYRDIVEAQKKGEHQ